MPEHPTPHAPDDAARRPPTSVHDTGLHDHTVWQGPTYYGRPQLKAAPFNPWVVGGYVAVAGIAGTSAIISALADAAHGRHAEKLVRRGRYLTLLAPTLGAGLLIYDLHTPKRFYNMFRVAKGTSPMSIGTWILSAFSVFAGATAALQAISDRLPRLGWTRRLARMTAVPSALAGGGMSVYTAALLSATSTPLWAAAPRQMAARFGCSSMAAGAALLSLLEGDPELRESLDALTLTALCGEAVAGLTSHHTYRDRGVLAALTQSRPGHGERFGATLAGGVLPAALHLASFAAGKRASPGLSRTANILAIAGSILLRVTMMEAGNVSASRPDISFRFSQPENLPAAERLRRLRTRT